MVWKQRCNSTTLMPLLCFEVRCAAPPFHLHSESVWRRAPHPCPLLGVCLPVQISQVGVTGLLDNAVFTVTKQRRCTNCKNTKLVLEHYIPPWQKVVLASSQLYSGLNPAPSCSLSGLKHRKGCAEPTEQQYLGQDNPTTIWLVHMLSAEARNVQAFHFYFFSWTT